MRYFLSLMLLGSMVTAAEPNYGIGPRDKFATVEGFTFRGQPITQAAAEVLVQAPTLPDDRAMPWVVHVAANRTEAVKTFALLSPLTSRFRLQSYAAGEWYTKHRDGTTRFQPGTTVLLPNGTEVYHTEDLPGLLKVLLGLAADFDLTKLRDLFRPAPPPPGPLPPIPEPASWPPWLWAVLGGAAVWIFSKRGK